VSISILHFTYLFGNYIKEKARGRRVIVWGKGWMESILFQTVNLHQLLDTACYISNDAEYCPQWRGKPVYRYTDMNITPEKDFVFVLAQPTFPEIRDTLRETGFKEFEDYYDIQKKVPMTKKQKEKWQNWMILVRFAEEMCLKHIIPKHTADVLAVVLWNVHVQW
jgi:hypothetical protein